MVPVMTVKRVNYWWLWCSKKCIYHFTDVLSQRSASRRFNYTVWPPQKTASLPGAPPGGLVQTGSTEWHYVTGLAVILLLLCITTHRSLWQLFLHILSLFICECFNYCSFKYIYLHFNGVSESHSEEHLIVFHNFLIALIWSISILSTLLVDQK